jgi:hypothetical protein
MKIGTWKSFLTEWCKWNFTPIFFFSPNLDGVWYRQSAHWASMNFLQIGAVHLWVYMKFFSNIFCIFFLSWIKCSAGDVHYNLIESIMNNGTVKQYYVLGHKWVCTFHFFCLICVEFSIADVHMYCWAFVNFVKICKVKAILFPNAWK